MNLLRGGKTFEILTETSLNLLLKTCAIPISFRYARFDGEDHARRHTPRVVVAAVIDIRRTVEKCSCRPKNKSIDFKDIGIFYRKVPVYYF
jgi:hypothetical protein